MWNKSIALPVKKLNGQDSEGFETDVTYEFMGGIPANFKDTTRNDEVLAAQKGYSADQNIEIMACNYNGASFLVDESNQEVYDVKRTHRKDKDMLIVLTCERRERGGI